MSEGQSDRIALVRTYRAWDGVYDLVPDAGARTCSACAFRLDMEMCHAAPPCMVQEHIGGPVLLMHWTKRDAP